MQAAVCLGDARVTCEPCPSHYCTGATRPHRLSARSAAVSDGVAGCIASLLRVGKLHRPEQMGACVRRRLSQVGVWIPDRLCGMRPGREKVAPIGAGPPARGRARPSGLVPS